MKPIRPHRLALAVASLLLTLAAPSGRADVSVSGGYHFDPGGNLPVGPGDLAEPTRTLWIGNGAGNGSFAALAGSSVDLGALFVSASGSIGTVLIDGAGTRLTLHRSGNGSRLELGNFGTATMTVSGGASLDARSAACVGYCGSVVANSTGTTGLLRVQGSGSTASFLSLTLGNAGMDNRFDFGRPGLTSQGRLDVLDGAAVTASALAVAVVYANGFGANGQERAVGQLELAGPSSSLLLDGHLSGEAGLYLGTTTRADGQATVSDGALLRLAATDADKTAIAKVGGNGGTGSLTITGAGSRMQLQAAPGRAIVRVAEGGSGQLSLLAGGALSGADEVSVGVFDGSGALLVSGSGSSLTGRDSSSVLNIGAGWNGGIGSVRVDAGAQVQMGRLAVGVDSPSQNHVVLSGSGTRLELNGTNNERLYVGNGSITISGGAVLDARADEANCAGGVWCATKIGTVAGSQGSLTVDGAGSVGRFTGHFQVGVTDLATQAADGWTRGTPGGQTLASVKVLNGGLVQTDHITMALGTFSAGATGTESAIANLTVQGAGSRFEVLGRDGLGSYLQTVTWNAQNSSANLAVLDGGVLALQAHEGGSALMSLSNLAGSTRMQVRGAGSTLSFAANEVGRTSLQLARSAGSFADIAVSQGGLITGNEYLTIGTAPGAVGTVAISGAGSAYVSGGGIAYTSVGYTGGQGSLAVTDGGLLQMQSGQSALRVGIGTRDGVAANGLLRIAGGTVNVVGRRDASHALGIGMGFMQVGNDAQGSVQVSNGGQLLISSDGDAQASNGWLGSGLTVGKSNVAVGGGQLLVSGPGSRVDTVGTNPFVTIGTGSQASGALRITHGGVVVTTLMGVGDLGAMGSVGVDAATLRLDGAWRSGVTIGASLALGSGGGTGLMTLANGSQLLIHADGAERGSLALGGSWFSPGGVGVLQAAGSAISVTGAGGGQVVVGATAGGIGTLSLTGGSTLVTDYLGVGAFDGADSGGVGTLIVNGTSTLTAATIEIGARGYVGGTGTLIGNVINRGVFSPGNSPGTLHVQGSFVNQAGGRLVLEVESDGQGGFVTDQLVFGAGGALDLGGLQIEFRFLGATDPNAFQASGGFQIDSFLSQAGTPLDHALLDGVSYAASSSAYQFTSFTFSADGGAVFAAQPVPEPGTWVLFVLGLGVTGWLRKRRKR
ncbi:MAG: PEP-CTERM sorting domain-containing protein [Roseateles sp.]